MLEITITKNVIDRTPTITELYRSPGGEQKSSEKEGDEQ